MELRQTLPLKFWLSFLPRFYFPEPALARRRFRRALHQISSIPHRSAPWPNGSRAAWDRSARLVDTLIGQDHIFAESNILVPEPDANARHQDGFWRFAGKTIRTVLSALFPVDKSIRVPVAPVA